MAKLTIIRFALDDRALVGVDRGEMDRPRPKIVVAIERGHIPARASVAPEIVEFGLFRRNRRGRRVLPVDDIDGADAAMGARRAHHQIIDAVAIHVAAAGDGEACAVAGAANFAGQLDGEVLRRGESQIDGQRFASRGHCAGGEITPPDQIRLARAAIGFRRSDDEILVPVIIHVASGGDLAANAVQRTARYAEAFRRIDVRQVVIGEKRREVVATVNDVGRAGIDIAVFVRARRADDQVGESVAIHIAQIADGIAKIIVEVETAEIDARHGAADIVEIDRRGTNGGAGIAEDHIGFANVIVIEAVGVRARRGDDEIKRPIAVEIADFLHVVAKLVRTRIERVGRPAQTVDAGVVHAKRHC